MYAAIDAIHVQYAGLYGVAGKIQLGVLHIQLKQKDFDERMALRIQLSTTLNHPQDVDKENSISIIKNILS
jgi:hypothetical protein